MSGAAQRFAGQRANFVNGSFRSDGDGTHTIVLDKYSGKELARLPNASEAQMEEAIAAAVASRRSVALMTAGERGDKLNVLASLIEQRRDELATLIVHEAGKPVEYAKGEISRCISTVRTAAGEALRFAGEVVPLDYGVGAGRTAFTKRVPIGVVAAITPFNFPLNLVLHKVAPAMAVGCPVIVKPAPQAPLSALALAGLVQEITWPVGGLHVLVSGIPVAEQLVRDARVAMLSFTGSDSVGWHLKSICGKKKVALELGGNASVIVDEGTDLAAAAKSVAMAANLYAGQTCISTQRIFAVQSVFEEFRDRLVTEFDALRSGDPADEGVSVGPIIDQTHFDRISAWVDEAVRGGATLLCGGRAIDAVRHVFAATLLTNTTRDMKVNCAEAFGPVSVLESVADFGQAIARVNDSRYGLQAGVFTQSVAHMKRAHAELEVGGIIVNGIPGFRIDSMPYGGVKDSGLGREGVRYAMEEMTEPRLLVF
jgi:glyceraldehyde-3-phosphate dehydrogenase (NADP+)